jgi:hypothetical protein
MCVYQNGIVFEAFVGICMEDCAGWGYDTNSEATMGKFLLLFLTSLASIQNVQFVRVPESSTECWFRFNKFFRLWPDTNASFIHKTSGGRVKSECVLV